jgi:hypothetical protein
VDYAKNCREPVLVARDGIYDLLRLLCDELVDRPTLSEGDPYSDFAFYRPREILIYALLSVYWFWSEAEGWQKPPHKALIEKTIPAAPPPEWLWGEGAIPHFLTYAWYRKCRGAVKEADAGLANALASLLNSKLGRGPDLASPYYDIEDVVKHDAQQILGVDDPFEGDGFEGDSYFCESLLTCLVRADLKQECIQLWPDFTRINHERVVPDQAWRYCRYRTGDEAENQTKIYPPTGQWSELREAAKDFSAEDIPRALKADPILLLLFTIVFPFRASFSAVKFLHREFDKTWSL